jgi:hypothetical protein
MIYLKSGAEALDGLYVKAYQQFNNKKHWCRNSRSTTNSG